MVDAASIIIVATGFLLGLAHALDPDHIVAVSTLLCNSPSLRKSIVSATAWGAGHSVTLILVGLLVLALRIAIPESVVNLFEFAAGTMLIVLGIFVLKPFIADQIHMHQHGNITLPHSHTHSHVHSPNKNHDHTHVHKSVLTGVLQGMAGSAAIMLVTLTTVNSAALGLIFILVFGGGVILGMICISCLISSILTYTASHLEKVHEKIKAITGFVSICFGVFIIVEVAPQLLQRLL
jgi:ABC-type nickel/cobalt efflux system permease component RcnA